jgi:hypothetical protein
VADQVQAVAAGGQTSTCKGRAIARKKMLGRLCEQQRTTTYNNVQSEWEWGQQAVDEQACARTRKKKLARACTMRRCATYHNIQVKQETWRWAAEQAQAWQHWNECKRGGGNTSTWVVVGEQTGARSRRAIATKKLAEA